MRKPKKSLVDLTKHDEQLLVAKGGTHGLGNARFKSSTNRAPRKTTPGEQGDVRDLHLELKTISRCRSAWITQCWQIFANSRNVISNT